MSASASSCASSSGRIWGPPSPGGHDGQDTSPDGSKQSSEPWGSMDCDTCVQANSTRISYDGTWLVDDNDPSVLPVSTADRPGASLSFSFNGSGIIVFGAAPDASDGTSPPAEASYVLDDCTPLLSREPLDGSTDNTLLPLFATRDLAKDTPHSLVITIENASSPYVFAGFSIAPDDDEPGDGPPPPTFSGSWPPQPSNTAASSAPLDPSVSPDNLPATDAQHQGPDRTLVIALTSVLAGVLFILSVGCAIFLWRGWRRRQRQKLDMSERSILTTTDGSIMRNLPSLTWYSASTSASRENMHGITEQLEHGRPPSMHEATDTSESVPRAYRSSSPDYRSSSPADGSSPPSMYTSRSSECSGSAESIRRPSS
ncbi:hypothetical protein EV714DRAFT_280606 [Schizophyllum commune]